MMDHPINRAFREAYDVAHEAVMVQRIAEGRRGTPLSSADHALHNDTFRREFTARGFDPDKPINQQWS